MRLIKSLGFILLTLAGVAASAQTFEVDGINYNVLSEADGTVEVTSGDYSGDVVIPASVAYNDREYAVTTVGDHAFYTCDNLTSVSMPSVTAIGNTAFGSCASLTSVSMPSVTTIGDRAFIDCSSFVSVNMPVATTIGDEAFYLCSALTSVSMPSVTTIGNAAFWSCSSLTSVSIPASCTSIGDGVFLYCSTLEEITVDEDNMYYSSLEGVLYDKNKETILCCPCNKVSIDMPTTVTAIGDYAFCQNKYLTSVSMPAVTTIGFGAFYNCYALTSVSMPSATTIGGFAFGECYALTSVFMPSVTMIGDWAFSTCDALTSVSMPSVTMIGERAFYACDALTSVSMPSAMTIGDWAFCWGYALTSVDMPSVTTIGEYAFYDCSALTSVDIPASVTMIGNNAFSECSGLDSVYCHWEQPLECAPNFYETVLENATLYVPTGTVDAYSSTFPWSEFANIEEGGYSGIADTPQSEVTVKVIDGVITVEGGDGTASAPVVEVYSTGGLCIYRGTDSSIGGLPRGVYVVKVDGTVQKVAL